MAVVTDNLTFLSSYTPFERPPEAVTLYSLIPRGIRRFFFQDDISAKPVNDKQEVLLSATLPDAFAYSLARYDAVLTQDRAQDWNDANVLRLFNGIPGQPTGNAVEVLCNTQFVAVVGSVGNSNISHNVQLENFPAPFWSTIPGAPSFRARWINNNATVAAAGFLQCHADFYEYDLVQAQRYWVHTPQPVRI